MNRDFKLKFDAMRENNPGRVDKQNDDSFATAGHVRNICFVWPDGKMKFLNYAYLISGEYLPDENTIILRFTTEIISLKGFNLISLYEDILWHMPKSIACVDLRYTSINEVADCVVHEILCQ